MAATVRAVGFPWYERESYRRILEVMEDADKLHASYEKWLYAAQKGERELSSKGHIVVRAIIDPEEFVAWCRGRGLNVDANARMQFANEAAYGSVKQTH